jgi:hypothetical protein
MTFERSYYHRFCDSSTEKGDGDRRGGTSLFRHGKMGRVTTITAHEKLLVPVFKESGKRGWVKGGEATREG